MAMQLVIGGELVDGRGTEADPVLNPASEEVLAEIPSATVEDVFAAVDAARAAGAAWGSTTPAVRATALLKLADLLDAHADEFARIEAANVGKPLAAAAEEIPLCSDHLRFFAGAARVLEGRAAGEYVEGYTSMIRREPVGVVGQITPWNYPLAMAIWKIAPALAAGNTIVLKPSELTPLSTLRLAELSLEVLPPGVLNVVAGARQPGGRGDRHPPGGADGVADGLGAHRQGDRRRGVRDAGARAPGAGRQGAGGGARRRRRRRRGGQHEGGGVLQRGPGLHRGDADHRHPAGARRGGGGARAGGVGAVGWASRCWPMTSSSGR